MTEPSGVEPDVTRVAGAASPGNDPAGADSPAADTSSTGASGTGDSHARGRSGEPRLPTPRRWAMISAAIGGGIGTGLLGTSLHGHAIYGNGYVIPVGAAAALAMLVAVELFVGLWSRNAWVVVVCGAAAYLCAGLLSLQLGAFGMISSNLQGSVWLYGIALATPLVAWWAWAILRRSK